MEKIQTISVKNTFTIFTFQKRLHNLRPQKRVKEKGKLMLKNIIVIMVKMDTVQ